MQSMIDFTSWFLTNLPAFFMSEPIRYIWGLILTAYIFNCFLSLRRY